jgi:hypothetical protein
MKILVTSLTDHRIDVQLAKWFCIGLDELCIEYTTDIEDDCRLCIMFNGLSTESSLNKLEFIAERMPVVYMYDDCDMQIPSGVKLVASQFTNAGDIYFPIAELAVLDKLWENPIIKPNHFNIFYGGTFKARRDYTKVPNNHNTLLVGNDKGWDKWDGTTRLPTIKDMNLLYHIMAMCRQTLIVPDKAHDNINMPLRAFEGVFTDTDVLWYGDTIITPKQMKVLYTKEKTLRLIKELVCNIQQQV